MNGKSKSIIVVPCYNEVQRLRLDAFERHVRERPSTRFLLVNDGSTDATLELLHKLEENDPEHFGVIDVQPNRGKAEAVRRGMLAALDEEPAYAGYWDADLAAPLDEIPSFEALLDADARVEIVFGARVGLLGRSIRRRPSRHYLGRVFATVVSVMLRLSVYDTQCGAKLFRCSPELRELFAEPFVSNWVFDVEILARLIRARHGKPRPQAKEVIHELPLQCWHDVAGSKVKPTDFVRALRELAAIRRRYLRGLWAR